MSRSILEVWWSSRPHLFSHSYVGKLFHLVHARLRWGNETVIIISRLSGATCCGSRTKVPVVIQAEEIWGIMVMYQQQLFTLLSQSLAGFMFSSKGKGIKWRGIDYLSRDCDVQQVLDFTWGKQKKLILSFFGTNRGQSRSRAGDFVVQTGVTVCVDFGI